LSVEAINKALLIIMCHYKPSFADGKLKKLLNFVACLTWALFVFVQS